MAALLIPLIVTALAPPFILAAEPERYAYLFLQGKVSGRGLGRAEAGVTIRLISPTQRFESTTDDRGVFVFERLPVAVYDLQIVTPDGKVMRTIRPFDDPRGIRLEIGTGRGEGKALHVDPTTPGGRVAFAVPERAPDWRRFWKELGIIVGAAGVFAL